MKRAVTVVPCFNEAARIALPRFGVLAADGRSLLFVDDGSTDETLARLRAYEAAHPAAVKVLALERNQGKAEAVRQGLLAAIASGAEQVAYLDADLSTPPEEMVRVLQALESSDVALGSRVALLGRTIDRSAHRHVLGRVFATTASLALDLPVYDTQCGCKAFRVSLALEEALRRPFSMRWAFDVELLSRLMAPGGGVPPVEAGRFVEVPLNQWTDVKGSKLSPLAMVKAGLDVLGMAVRRVGRR